MRPHSSKRKNHFVLLSLEENGGVGGDRCRITLVKSWAGRRGCDESYWKISREKGAKGALAMAWAISCAPRQATQSLWTEPGKEPWLWAMERTSAKLAWKRAARKTTKGTILRRCVMLNMGIVLADKTDLSIRIFALCPTPTRIIRLSTVFHRMWSVPRSRYI